MPPLQIFGAPQSVFVRAIRLALEEKGVAYELIPASPHSAPVLAINPFGKIPVLQHGEIRLFESLAMIVYIDRVFSGPLLIGEDAVMAARAVQWACAITTSVFPAIVGYMQANAFPKGVDGKPDRAAIEQDFPKVRGQLEILEAILESGCLAGDAFGIADMYLMPMLEYLRMFPESGEAMRASKNLSRYFETNAQRRS